MPGYSAAFSGTSELSLTTWNEARASNVAFIDRPSRELLPSHSVCRERIRCSPDSPSSSPATPIAPTLSADITGCGPYSEAGATPVPRFSPWSGLTSASVPTSRLSQPDRTDEPGLASSTSSMAAKCERFGAGNPVAWTAATLPAVQNGSSGPNAGCRPNIPSLASSTSEAMAMLGRAA